MDPLLRHFRAVKVRRQVERVLAVAWYWLTTLAAALAAKWRMKWK